MNIAYLIIKVPLFLEEGTVVRFGHVRCHLCTLLQICRRDRVFLVLVDLGGHFQTEGVDTQLAGGEDITDPAVADMKAASFGKLCQTGLCSPFLIWGRSLPLLCPKRKVLFYVP